MHIKRMLAAGLAATLLALTGCGSTSTSSDAQTDTQSADSLKTVNVVLDWYPNAVHCFL